MHTLDPRRPALLALALAMLISFGGAAANTTAPAAAQAAPATVDVQLLAINDLHGNLEPPAGSGGTMAGLPAGGAEFLATHIRQLRSTNPNTMVVSAGDLIGASPLLSALFHDEPTIEAMNAIGLDINAVGNHEFDEGAAELLRMKQGGCHPIDGCLDGDGFGGAEFDFLAANVVEKRTREPLFPAFRVAEFDGVKVGFIGMTLEATPGIVTPSGVAHLDFLDEADTANHYAKRLREDGVEAIVVVLHEGGIPTVPLPVPLCPGISGPIVDIVERMDDAIDLVVSGHTHQPYSCVIDGRPVTSAASNGRLVTDIDLTLVRESGDVASVVANNMVVTREVQPDRPISALIAKYRAIAQPLANRVIGATAGALTRAPSPAGESALGDVIADSQLAATDDPVEGGAVAAFMNPGGIRADLDAGDVTYGEAFTVQPFGNNLVTMTLRGEQIDTLLEQQWCGQSAARILQVSATVSYTWNAARPACERVDLASITIAGAPVQPDNSYRITVNAFLADGGDGFTVLTQGSERLGGPVDLDAFERYVTDHSPVAAPAPTRIKVSNSAP